MKKLFGYFLYFLGTLLFLELVLRFCFPIPEFSNFNRINYQILNRVDNNQGYLRNIEMTWKSTLDTPATFVHHLNKYGYRDKIDWKAKKNKKRILFIGDSFVEGMMSTSEKTIPSSFTAIANENAMDYEVFNCGMMGIGLNEYMKFVKDAVPIYRPDEVMLVLYSNDAPFQSEYTPQSVLKPVENSIFELRIIKIIDQLKKGDPIPFRFSPEKRAFYKAVPDAGNPWTKNEATLKSEVTTVIADAMKKGDFNYFRTNWILQEDKFLKSPINIKNKLQFIRDYLKKYDCNLFVFYIPSRSQISNYYYQFERQACLTKCPDYLDLTGEEYQIHAKSIAQNCNVLDIPFKDFTPIIRKLESQGKHLYWNYDDHMKGDSYVMLGREIFEFWKKGD